MPLRLVTTASRLGAGLLCKRTRAEAFPTAEGWNGGSPDPKTKQTADVGLGCQVNPIGLRPTCLRPRKSRRSRLLPHAFAFIPINGLRSSSHRLG